MKKIKLWDLAILLLGLGIGIILSVSIFYYNPTVKYKEYSDKQIIEKYTEIKLKEQRKKEKDKSYNIKKEEKNDREINNKEIEFTIEKGESISGIIDNLYKSKIIDNKNSFLDRLKVREATGKIQYGTYKINLPIAYDELIDKIIIK